MRLETPRRGLSRLLPKTLFWRVTLAACALASLTLLCALLIAGRVSRDLVRHTREDAALTLLRNVVDLVGRSRMAMDELRVNHLDERKQSLAAAAADAAAVLSVYHSRELSQRLTREAARKTALEEIAAMGALLDPPVALLHHEGTAPARGFPGDGRVLARLEAAAKAVLPGTAVFDVAFPPKGAAGHPTLLAALWFYPWDLVLVSWKSLGDVEAELLEPNRGAVGELRARLGEITIAKSGYVFVFDADCTMIAHPSLTGQDFARLPLPGKTATLCQALKEAAERPFGENTLDYRWDRTDDLGHFVYDKRAWCVREPATGWYVGITAYAGEIAADDPRYRLAVFLPALGSVVLLAGALALFLRRALRPINDLSAACHRVSDGDWQARAGEDAPGEIGYLCRRFNAMVERLAELRRQGERRRAELEALNANLEHLVGLRTEALEQKARELTAANCRLTELDALKTAFLSSVSHEMRTPLTSILGFSKLIARDLRRLFPAKAQLPAGAADRAARLSEHLSIIVSESQRLTRLINDFLDLAKIESGRMELNPTAFPFGELAAATAASLAGLAAKAPDVALVLDVPDTLPPLFVDRDRLAQVLVNLLTNALKYTERGTVTLSACVGDGWLQARVADTGRGIPRPMLVAVFDKFQQVATIGADVLDKPKGTGLGLAICKNIVRQMGGIIWAESAPGQGTSVFFEIPLAGPEPEDA